MSQAPDLAEEVVAFRGWSLDVGWKRVELVSRGNFLWLTDAWSEAECGKCTDIPGEKCGCGIYAAVDRAHLFRIGYMGDHADIFGEVGLSGKVIPADLGWRAAKARIRRLWVPDVLWEYARPLAAAYHVPVHLTNPFQRSA